MVGHQARRRAASGGIWIGAILLVVGVGVPGIEKFGRLDFWADRFVGQWGLPAWLVPVTEGMEAVGAVLLFAAMMGATGTHLVHGEMNRFAFPLVFALLAALVGWARRRDAVGTLATWAGRVG